MTYEQALQYINNFTWSSSRPGLSRTKELLSRLKNPERDLRFVHVAGTNGKGSTCAMLASILKEAGYKTGLYPSPFLEDFRERIEINGEPIPKDKLAAITDMVSKEADAMEDHPSQFELITAIGMIYYKNEGCDIVVLEVGMGGELDSTNVIPPPIAAVITNIGFDHMEYLGNTIEEIARAKAGIIKTGSEVIVYDNTERVMDVIREACRKTGCSLHETAGLVRETAHNLDGQRFIYMPERAARKEAICGYTLKEAEHAQNAEYALQKAGHAYELGLIGENQLKNAAVVLKTIDVLREKGYGIDEEAVIRGLANVRWPARFEVLSKEPLFILDGGHNPQCAEALVENIEKYVPGGRVTFLIGMLADKDYEKTLEILRPYGANYICITPESPRALVGAELAARIKDLMLKEASAALNRGRPQNSTATKEAYSAKLTGSSEDRPMIRNTEADTTVQTDKMTYIAAYKDIPDAVEAAVGLGMPVVAFGSLYSAGKIRRVFLESSGSEASAKP